MPVGQECAWAQEHDTEFTRCIGWSCEGGAKCYRKRQAAQRRKAEAAAFRKFPGNDKAQARAAAIEKAVAHMPEAPRYSSKDPGLWEAWIAERNRLAAPFRLKRGHCNWCEGEIRKGPALNLRRIWHDGRGDEPDCLLELYLHTRTEYQLRHLIRRDGTRCAVCREEMGSWGQGYEIDPERRTLGSTYEPEVFVAPFTPVWREARLEVDHRLALGLVVLTIAPAERWRYWGPMNLQLLCRACHRLKTTEDVRKIKLAMAPANA